MNNLLYEKKKIEIEEKMEKEKKNQKLHTKH